MSRWNSTKDKIIDVLSDGVPKASSDVVKATGLSEYAVWDALYYWWKKGRLVRSEKPIFEGIKVFKGRAGVKKTTRARAREDTEPTRSRLHSRKAKF